MITRFVQFIHRITHIDRNNRTPKGDVNNVDEAIAYYKNLGFHVPHAKKNNFGKIKLK